MKKTIPIILLLLLISGRWVFGQAVTDAQLGLQYYSNREFDKAAALFERLYEKEPTHFNYTYLFMSLLETNELNDAAKLVKKQSRKHPDELRYMVDEGYVLIRNNESNKAHKVFNKAIDELPADQRKVMELANAFMSRRENEYAIRTYQKGRQMLSPKYTFGMELAYLYESMANYAEMTREYLNQLEANPAVLNQLQARLQNSFNRDPEGRISEAMREALLERIQRNPDELIMSELMLWLTVQLKDFEMALIQARALDRRLEENGGRVFNLATLSSSSEDFATATQAYNYVIEHSGNMELVARSRVALLQIEYEQLIRHYPIDLKAMRALEKRYTSTLEEAGSSPLAFPLMRNLAHIRAFYLGDTQQAIAGLEALIGYSASDPLMQAESKLELADIMLFTGEPWEASLLYSQVDKAFKSEPIGHEARFRGARLSFYLGEFDWARAQLDVLKAATSKLIANDAMALSLLITDNIGADSSTAALSAYARADLLLFRNHTAEAQAVLDSMLLAFPGHEITDDVLLKKAEINVSNGNFAEAAENYTRVANEFNEGVLADDALFKLGTLYQEHIKDKTKAMETFEKLLMEHPGSIFVIEARKRFRSLRGDGMS